MSRNIQQIFTDNPITSNTSTDLMYFGQSPYGTGDDAAMTFANFSAQFGSGVTPAALTRVDDTNVTLTLGGTPATALLQATSITAGWSGQLSLTRGGTNASLTASNGGIFYSTATAGAILAGNATARKMLQSGATAAPAWSTATWPATTTINNVLYSSANNVVAEIASVANAVLATDGSGVPSMSTSLPAGFTITGYARDGANADITSLNALTGIIAAPTRIEDALGNAMFTFASFGIGAVNNLGVTNQPSGGVPSLYAEGTDPDIFIGLNFKGAAGISIYDSALSNPGLIKLFESNNTSGVGFKSPAVLAGNTIWELPAVDGSSGDVMTTNGAGVLSFLPAGGGGSAQTILLKTTATQNFNSGAAAVITGMDFTPAASKTYLLTAYISITPQDITAITSYGLTDGALSTTNISCVAGQLNMYGSTFVVKNFINQSYGIALAGGAIAAAGNTDTNMVVITILFTTTATPGTCQLFATGTTSAGLDINTNSVCIYTLLG